MLAKKFRLNNLVICKMRDETNSMYIKSFAGIKSNLYAKNIINLIK